MRALKCPACRSPCREPAHGEKIVCSACGALFKVTGPGPEGPEPVVQGKGGPASRPVTPDAGGPRIEAPEPPPASRSGSPPAPIEWLETQAASALPADMPPLPVPASRTPRTPRTPRAPGPRAPGPRPPDPRPPGPRPPSEAAARHDGLPGIPGHRILRSLHQTELDELLEGQDEVSGERVTIRLLTARYSRDPHLSNRVDQEVAKLAGLRHRAFVRVRARGWTSDNRLYYVTDLEDGTSLREEIDGGFLSTRIRAGIILEIAEALGEAHGAGLVHLGLEPTSLVMSSGPGRRGLKIHGLGASSVVRRETRRNNLTRIGSSVGAVFYMSPEQRTESAEVDHRSDIFSLGILFYELLTGRVPMGSFVSPSRRNPDVHPECDGIVERMLDSDSARRYQTMAEVIAALRGVVGPGDPLEDEVGPSPAREAVRSEHPATVEAAGIPAPRWITASMETDQETVPVEGRSAPRMVISITNRGRELQVESDHDGLFFAAVPVTVGRNRIVATTLVTGAPPSKELEVSRRPAAPELDPLPAEVDRPRLEVSGRSGPGLKIVARVGNHSHECRADDGGRFRVTLDLEEPLCEITARSVADDLESPDAAPRTVLFRLPPPRPDPLPGILHESTFILAGSAAPGTTLEVQVGSTCLQGKVEAGGRFSVPVQLGIGNHEVLVRSRHGTVESGTVGPFRVSRRISRTLLQVGAALAGIGFFLLAGRTLGPPRFEVDPVEPSEVLEVQGRASPGVLVRLRVREQTQQVRTGTDGRFRFRLDVPPGRVVPRLEEILDGDVRATLEMPPIAILPRPPVLGTARVRTDRTILVSCWVDEGSRALARVGGRTFPLDDPGRAARAGRRLFEASLPGLPDLESLELVAVTDGIWSRPVAPDRVEGPDDPGAKLHVPPDATDPSARPSPADPGDAPPPPPPPPPPPAPTAAPPTRGPSPRPRPPSPLSARWVPGEDRAGRVTGRARPRAGIVVREGSVVGRARADEEGLYEVAATLDHGPHALEIAAVDDGVESEPLFLDVAVPPPAPSDVRVDAGPDGSAQLSGRALPGGFLSIQVSGRSLGLKVGSDGRFRVDLPGLGAGTHVYRTLVRAGSIRSRVLEGSFDLPPQDLDRPGPRPATLQRSPSPSPVPSSPPASSPGSSSEPTGAPSSGRVLPVLEPRPAPAAEPAVEPARPLRREPPPRPEAHSPRSEPGPVPRREDPGRREPGGRSRPLRRIPGTLRLRTVPPGARVLIRGIALRSSPVEIQLDPGERSLHILHPGFRPWTGSVEIQPGTTTVLDVVLESGASIPDAPGPVGPDPAPRGPAAGREVSGGSPPDEPSPAGEGATPGAAPTEPPEVEAAAADDIEAVLDELATERSRVNREEVGSDGRRPGDSLPGSGDGTAPPPPPAP